jgi:uncharacterized membrane protein
MSASNCQLPFYHLRSNSTTSGRTFNPLNSLTRALFGCRFALKTRFTNSQLEKVTFMALLLASTRLHLEHRQKARKSNFRHS